MRTTITMDDDVHEFASIYASANGITLSKAVGELIRKTQVPSRHDRTPTIERLANGFPVFPRAGKTITDEIVKQLEEQEFDAQIPS
jgi:hypothetical protein